MARAFRRRPAASLIALLAAGLALAACEGTNAFSTPPGSGNGNGNGNGGGQTDATAPTVVIQKPDSAGSVAVGEQLYVEARVTDNAALDSVVIRAFVQKGSAELGTDTSIARFGSKTVRLGGTSTAVKDTVIKRFLDPLDSTRVNNVRVVVTAYDTAGNRKADTTTVNVGGPRVQIVGPPAGTQLNGGTTLAVQVVAVDSAQFIRTVRLRGSGAFAFDTTVQVNPARAVVTDTIVVPIPAVIGTAVVQGNEDLVATATTPGGQPATSTPVTVVIRAAAPDVTPPQVSFNAVVPGRIEVDDTLTVTAQATDATRVDTVGITVFAIHPRAGGEDTLATFTHKARAAADSMSVLVSQVPLTGLDTLTLRFAVTAWATDPAGNCGTAVSPNTPQAQRCVVRAAGGRVADVAGWSYVAFVARGLTIPPPNNGDVLADLLADSSRVYLSNFTRNRLELLPLGATTYSGSVRVGSQPWGLALGRFRDSLYVANSGGTNISVIPLTGGVLAEAQDKRIFTRNERLFAVKFSEDAAQLVSEVRLTDYSDRPQFIAQASNGLLVYSTMPTQADTDGTVRIYDPRKLRSEIFTGYVDRHTPGRAIAVNADSAFGTPDLEVIVCPRRRFGDTTDPQCIKGRPSVVSDSLTKLRMLPANASGGKWDARLDIGAFINDVGLSDTTFVAASGDRNYIAVGEGARVNARIPMFNAPAGGDSLVLVGDVRDLISNAAERVIGLGINFDGSLGVARGSQAYYFGPTLRLQGVVAAGSPTGGVAMHPGNAGYPGGSFRLSFVSGIDEKAPYVDVIDNFNFFRVKRVYTRDPVIGAMAVAPRAGGDAAAVNLRIYALTTKGVLALTITNSDLVP
ncbi:MAG TPA: hypothetical protein VF541_00585 [Longimicrobium sp.]